MCRALTRIMLVAVFVGSLALIGAGCDGGQIELFPAEGVDTGAGTDVDTNGENGGEAVPECPDCVCNCEEECCEEELVCECNAEAICTVDTCCDMYDCCDGDDFTCGCKDVDLDECCPDPVCGCDDITDELCDECCEFDVTCQDISADFCRECGYCPVTGEFDPFDCAFDLDGDLVINSLDTCVNTWQYNQRDTDGDGVGDVCDCDPGVVAQEENGSMETRCTLCNPDDPIPGEMCPCGTTEDPFINPVDCCFPALILCREECLGTTRKICLPNDPRVLCEVVAAAGEDADLLYTKLRIGEEALNTECDGDKREFCFEIKRWCPLDEDCSECTSTPTYEGPYYEGDLVTICADLEDLDLDAPGTCVEIVECPPL